MQKKLLYILMPALMAVLLSSAQHTCTKATFFPESKYRLFGLSQELKLGNRVSIQTTFRFMPETLIPEARYAAGTYKSYDNNPLKETYVKSAGNVTEIRLYTIRRKALRGFYWGPYFSANKYSMHADNYSATIKIDYNHSISVPLQQKCGLLSIGGGLQFGVQKIIGKHFLIDWTILGVGLTQVKMNARIDAVNVPPEFDLREYPSYFTNTKYSFEKYYPVTKNAEAHAINLSGKGMLPMARMSVSIGFAY